MKYTDQPISSSSLIFGAKKYLTLPSLSILYSTTIGVSAVSFRVTVGDRVEALLKMLRYLRAKDEVTGSSTSKIVYTPDSSSPPMVYWDALIVVLPEQLSPLIENLMASLLVSIITFNKLYHGGYLNYQSQKVGTFLCIFLWILRNSWSQRWSIRCQELQAIHCPIREGIN